MMNTGAVFEETLKNSCEYYKYRGIALIHKIPTPWSVTYDKKSFKVKNAYPQEKSSVDFEGVWHGRSIAFEAKSTRERKRFDLKNIQQHQIDYLLQHQDQGGISFLLVEFSNLGETYLIFVDQFNDWVQLAKNGGRRSIPYDWIQMNCCIVVPERAPLDFIRVLERERSNEAKRISEPGEKATRKFGYPFPTAKDI
jgi:recombination protein U